MLGSGALKGGKGLAKPKSITGIPPSRSGVTTTKTPSGSIRYSLGGGSR